MFTTGSIKDMIVSPVVLALQSSVRADFDSAWMFLSTNDTAAIRLAARSKSSSSIDSDLIAVPYTLFQKILATEPFSKYKKCCTVFGKRGSYPSIFKTCPRW